MIPQSDFDPITTPTVGAILALPYFVLLTICDAFVVTLSAPGDGVKCLEHFSRTIDVAGLISRMSI